MKLKVACILLTGITLSFMWYFSPLYADVSRPTVETISAKSEHIFDTVMTHGYVEETNKKILRLDKTSVVNTVYCSVGDYVNEGSVILDVCEKEKVNQQNIYNMRPEQIHYDIADWAIAGNRLSPLGEALWFYNPFSSSCRQNFPNENGYFITRIGKHCFYNPNNSYYET